MKVLWPHNFDLSKPNAGIFMLNAAQGLKDLGADIHLEYLGNLSSPFNIFKAYKRVNEISKNFDIIHAQYGSACAFVVSKVKLCPKILTLRGSDWNVYFTSNSIENLHSVFSTQFTRLAINSYNIVITVSKRLESEVKKRNPNIEVVTLPSPIDLQRFLPLNKAVARAAFGFQNNIEKWILFTANNTNNPLKRYRLAKRAVEIANEKIGNIRLRIATGIPHSDVPQFVGACDLVLCTSVSEGWPNSIKEALACNIPFVSTDVSDLKVIASREPSCRVCEPDPVILAKNICEVLQSKENIKLRDYVSEMSMQNISSEMYALYKSL